MLSRLRASAWVRGGLLAIVLAFCGYSLDAEWPAVSAGLTRLHWYSVALSLAAAMMGSGCMMLGWRAILADLGSPLRVRPAARVNFLAQLGKYLPGAVWAFAAQVELSADQQVPRRRGMASIVVSLAVVVGAGLAVAAMALPFAAASLSRYSWILLAVPVIAISLYPPVLGRLIDGALAIVRQPPLERTPTLGGLARALAWTLLGWVLLGVQVWLVLADMAGHRGYLLAAIGGYALAFSAGLLLIVFPSGIGAREVILIAALAPVLPHGRAVAVALVIRVVTTVSDLALGGVGLAIGRARWTEASSQPGPVPQPMPAQQYRAVPQRGGRHRGPGTRAGLPKLTAGYRRSR